MAFSFAAWIRGVQHPRPGGFGNRAIRPFPRPRVLFSRCVRRSALDFERLGARRGHRPCAPGSALLIDTPSAPAIQAAVISLSRRQHHLNALTAAGISFHAARLQPTELALVAFGPSVSLRIRWSSKSHARVAGKTPAMPRHPHAAFSIHSAMEVVLRFALSMVGRQGIHSGWLKPMGWPARLCGT